jgi:hypothetical protein
MISIKYKPLFDVEILHSFYSSGKCPDLMLVPTADCQTKLQYLGLRFLPTDFGGTLFGKVKTVGTKDIIKNPVPDNTKFSFLLRLTRNVFENFTNINLNRPKDNHYYFNNLISNISSASLPLLVTNTGTKIVSDTDLLPFFTNTLSYVHNNATASQSGEIRFIDTGEIFQQTLSNYKNVFNFSFDLSKTPGGRVKLFVEGEEKASVYAIEQGNYKDLFGVVEIFYRTGLPAAYQFQNADNSIVTRFYKISFTNRSTKWRYVISKIFDQSVTGVSVAKTNGTAIAFTAQGGAPANQFIMASNNPVPLVEGPVSGIKLSNQSNKIIIENLPNPPLNLVRAEGADVFSDILITI